MRRETAFPGCALIRILDVAHNVGEMTVVCPHCAAQSWPDENISCCGNGQIVLPDFPDVPVAISSAIYSPQVMAHIRQYNMSLCMASLGHKNKSPPGYGAFILGGRTFHRIGSMLPAANDHDHCFAQIYVLDTEDATRRRMDLFNGRGRGDILRAAALSTLHQQLRIHNPWISQFVAAARDSIPQLVWRSTDDLSTMQIGAVVAETGDRRDIVVKRFSGELQFIDDGHGLYHPLAYPLLFPLGSLGWNDNMMVVNHDHTSDRRLSLTEWGRYYMMHRNNTPTHWQKCGRLTAEFYCDMWAQVEARSANFHRSPSQQLKYRAGRVAAIEDQLHAGVPASEIGKNVVRLPSSFVGSARYYQQLYLDAMALPRRFGKPDLFITITCDPKWPEITAAIPAGSNWKDHLDIVERVFMLKLKALIKDIKKSQIFGKCKAYVYRIEWQARGLPHAHMLVILQDKILAARHIDMVVSAELPNPATDPVLFELVTKHNLHPRCDVDVEAGCRSDHDGKLCDCKRNFPKDMSTETVIIGDGFPKYRRRGLFTTTDKSGRIVTDNWVVPYNQYLTLKYRCHINVEVCAHIRSFKYVYKYTFKAPDHTAISIDEIEAHLSGRLLSASEAVHRLLGLQLHKEWPAVVRLDVHLPHHQVMVFNPLADEMDLLQQIAATTSTLMGWFHLNSTGDSDAISLLYHEVPEHYVWIKQSWQRRQNRGKMAVGRIYGVTPNNVELYSLRRLLTVVKGATCFQDLATFEGCIYTCFRDALYARGMVQCDSDISAAFREIVEVEVCVPLLRRHFARILVHSAPQDAKALFSEFAEDMCEGPADDPDVMQEALRDLEMSMNDMGRSLEDDDYGFVLPNWDVPQADHAGSRRVRRRFNGNTSEITAAAAAVTRDRLYQVLTDEQHIAFHEVMQSIGSPNISNVFANLSSAGCGKTVFANCLAATVRADGRIAVCVAASALAAMLLDGGSTAHSKFHIPIPANECSICHLSAAERSMLKKSDLILWDECSMVHTDVADTVHRTLQDVMHDDRPFGGKTVCFMGDFKQLLPVIRYGKGHEHTIQRCQWWANVRRIQFTKNWRAVEFPEYCNLLESIGTGGLEYVDVPASSVVGDLDSLVTAVYGDNIACNKNQILALTLETCKIVNKLCLSRMAGDMVECPAADFYPDCKDPDGFPTDYVESIEMHGAPPFGLELKVGAKYMCIRNLDVQRGIINGTMLELLRIGHRFIQVRLLSGNQTGSVELLTKCIFSITPEASGLPFTVVRRQYPIICAYSLSVHKAQGQSISLLGLVMDTDVFAHGQLYVAFSRVADTSRMKILMRDGETRIRNMVFKHLL